MKFTKIFGILIEKLSVLIIEAVTRRCSVKKVLLEIL